MPNIISNLQRELADLQARAQACEQELAKLLEVKGKVKLVQSTEPPNPKELLPPDTEISISPKDKATSKELSDQCSMIQEEEPLS